MKQESDGDSASYKFDVFLSHNSKDKHTVLEIANKLRSQGLRVWYDDWCIKIGDDIYQKIEQGLQDSRIFIFCVSDNSLSSEWVSLEKNTAIFRDPSNKSKSFYPIILSNLTIKLPQTLQRIKFGDYRKHPESVISDILSLQKALSHSPVEKIDTSSRSKKLILVVDDEEHTLRGFERIFRDQYDIVTATTVDSALIALSNKIQNLSVAIVDQRLPKRNGWELLEYLRRNNPRAIRILSSAYSDFNSLVDSINKASVHSFVPKPWDIDHLKLMITHATRAHDEQLVAPSFVMEISPPIPTCDSTHQNIGSGPLLTSNSQLLNDLTHEVNKDNFTSSNEYSAGKDINPISQSREAASFGFNALRARSLNPVMASICSELELFIISFQHESQLSWSYIFEIKMKKLIRHIITSKDYLKFYNPEMQMQDQGEVVYGLNLLKNSLNQLFEKHGETFSEYHFSTSLAEKLLGLIDVIDTASLNAKDKGINCGPLFLDIRFG